MKDLRQRWKHNRKRRIEKIPIADRCNDCREDAASIKIWSSPSALIPDKQLCVGCWSLWETKHANGLGWMVTPVKPAT
jgi:hypothetical protein